MFKHSLTRRTRAALIAAAAAAAMLTSPAPASAEPRAGHFIIESVNADGVESDERPATEGRADDRLFDVCPVDGAATYEDSWGWARSGGRSHQGVDMIAGRGTPIVAVRDGDALFKQNRLGGNAVWLTAADGDKFYYAHLDSFVGQSRTVEAGELIGYVGSTGNAQGPHLHFETLPGGRVENPYPHTLRACVPSPEEVAAIAAHEANRLNDPGLWARFLPRT